MRSGMEESRTAASAVASIGDRMARNIVLCFDGTNNRFGTENTNVVRLVQMLQQDPTQQRIYYDPGVGTLPEPGALTAVMKTATRVVALAFGAGLMRNV